MIIYGPDGPRPFVFEPPSNDSAGATSRRLVGEWEAARVSWRAAHNKEAESARKQGRHMPDSCV